MELAVYPFALLVDQLDGVPEVAVHEAEAVRDSAVAHEDHDLVDGLGVLGEVVPEGRRVVCVCEVSGWISFLGVDEVWEFGGVAQEEDGCVVCY